MRKPKKTSANYGQFYFRIDKATQVELEAQIERILSLYNEDRSEKLKLVKRNEVILLCLEKSLQALEMKLINQKK